MLEKHTPLKWLGKRIKTSTKTLDNSRFTDIHKEKECYFSRYIRCKKSSNKSDLRLNINLISIYSKLSLKILNNNNLLNIFKSNDMTLKKSGRVLNLLYLWKVKVIMTYQHWSFMKEILLQILFLPPMPLMTFSQQLLRKCNQKF